MKGKFRILGHVGLALFVAVALMVAAVPAAKVEASSVGSVWMELPAGAVQTENEELAIEYTIHFTTGKALSRGVDTITVLFPDGIDTNMGPANTAGQTDRAFDLSSADSSAAYYSVDPTGDPLEDGAGYVTCTANATVAGYRVQVTTPVDIPASTAAILKIASTANIVTPTHDQGSGTINTYMIKVATSQDTTFVLSSAFPIGTALDIAPATYTNFPSSEVAGANAHFKFTFQCITAVPIGGTVTVEFPVGTTLTSPVDAGHVTLGNNVLDPGCSTVSVNTAARTLTATTAKALVTGSLSYIYIEDDALIYNPTTIEDDIKVYIWTSTDGLKVQQSDTDWDVVADTATKLEFVNRAAISTYSDDATILYAFTDALIIRSVDQYGNLKEITGTEPTVALSKEGGTGTFSYTSQTTANPYTDHEMADGKLYADAIYYRPTSVGTHTLKAETVGNPSLTLATWTVYVAPAVVLKDANDIEIGTYGPLSTSTTDATYGGAHIQSAIDAAFPGDTVELGGTAAAPAIYELDTVLCLNKKVTLTSATSALYTTLRPVDEPLTGYYITGKDIAMYVYTDGTPANPIIIDGLTFTRLRLDDEFDIAIYNNGYDYVTVRNCAFNYIMPESSEDSEWGAVVAFVVALNQDPNAGAITSATISNNDFNNCCPFYLAAGDPAVINLMTKAGAGSLPISGATVSGNELTDCNGINISIEGYTGTVTANITDNIITNGKLPMYINQQTDSVNVLRNTITGGYNYGIRVGSFLSADHDDLVIKNNTITGCAGAQSATQSYAIWLQEDGGALVTDINTVQFNDIYDNDAEYSIFAESDINEFAQDCQYNYFGDSTGPYYSALSGATVTTSNTAGTGDKVTDLVTYYPWLYKSRAFVVTDNANYCAQRISLAVGIHTLSTPALLITTADTIAELIPDYATLYDGKAKMEYCYKFDDGIWSNIGDDTLTACRAYYIKMTVADSVVLQYDADEYDTPQWLLDEGWNLISLANLESKRVDRSVASVLLDSAGLPGYSQVISPSMNASPWSYSAGGDTSGKNMAVGEGYWIYMQNDATLAGFTIFPLVPDLD